MKFSCAVCATALLALAGPAFAYTDSLGNNIPATVPIDNGTGTPMGTAANPQHVTGSFSASIGAFAPTPSYATLAVGASSTSVALPTGTVVVVYNTGATTAYVKLGTTSGVTATASDDVIPAGGWMAFTVGSNTWIAGIETSGATSLTLSGGSGLPAGSGGGSGVSGGGGSGSTVQATNSTPISISTATTTSLITNAAGQYTYITGWDVIAAGAGNFQLVYGTTSSTPCDTGQTALTGNYNLTAQAGEARGAGTGLVLVAPTGKDVCAVTSAAITYSGSIAYTQSSTAATSFGGGSGGSSASVGVTGASAPGSATLIGAIDGSGNLQGASSTNPVPVSGSFSATVSGFTPSASSFRMTPLTVTTSDSSATLPTGAVTIVSNVGTTNPMYCNVNEVAATTSDQLITANGGWFAFTIPGGTTHLHCIATGGSTTANGLGGQGIPTGTGGGSGGSGGGGGAVTMASSAVAAGAYSAGAFVSGSFLSGALADGAITTLGTEADTAWTSGSGTAIAILKKIAGNLAVTAAGSSASNALPIQGVTGGVNVPVSGTIVANAGTGTFTVADSKTTGASSAQGTPASNPFTIQGCPSCSAVPVTGSFSASVGSFAPTPAYATLTVGSTSSRVALPTGATVVVYNTGANPAFVTLGNSGITATSSDDVIQPGSWMAFVVGSNVDLAAIETAGATTLNLSGGSGLPAGSGGGGGNSSSTLAGTSATSALPVQGVTGGVPMVTDVPKSNAGTSATTAAAIQGVTGGVPLNVNVGITSGASIPINISTATTTQLVALSAGKSIYVTAWDVISGGIGNLTLEYGTGSNCGTGTTALTGPYGLSAQAGISKGDGLGTVLIVPSGNALCALTSAAVQMSGSLTYTQQ